MGARGSPDRNRRARLRHPPGICGAVPARAARSHPVRPRRARPGSRARRGDAVRTGPAGCPPVLGHADRRIRRAHDRMAVSVPRVDGLRAGWPRHRARGSAAQERPGRRCARRRSSRCPRLRAECCERARRGRRVDLLRRRGVDCSTAFERAAGGHRFRRFRARRHRRVRAGVRSLVAGERDEPGGVDRPARARRRSDAAECVHRAARDLGDRSGGDPGGSVRPSGLPRPRPVLADHGGPDRRRDRLGADDRTRTAGGGDRPGHASARARSCGHGGGDPSRTSLG